MPKAIKEQVPCQKEIVLLHEIRNRILIGHSKSQIAKDFNQRGIPTRHIDGKEWTSKTIGYIASNPVYAGISINKKSEPKYNPINETYFNEPLPPDDWEYNVLPDNSIYQVWTPVQYIEMQKMLLSGSTGKRGRKAGTFGAFVLSGILFCGHCGGIMESAGGKPPYYLRCCNCKKHAGTPGKCFNKVNIPENLVTKAVLYIVKQLIEPFYESCMKIFNEQLHAVAATLLQDLDSKKLQHQELLDKREAIIDMFTRARRQGLQEDLNEYPAMAAENAKKLKALEHEICYLEQAKEVVINPLVLNPVLLRNEMDNLDKIFDECSDVAQKRTAIKRLIPKILIKVKRVDRKQTVILLEIPEMPVGMENALKNHYSFISKEDKVSLCPDPAQGTETFKQASLWRVWQNTFPERKNSEWLAPKAAIQELYDKLSNRYQFDKLSYYPELPIPVYIEGIIIAPSKYAAPIASVSCYSMPHRDHPVIK
jgi:Recombinase/Recombinase zinc beta ribbon domain